ncbi:hypothetical protein CJ030_MR4G020646 [Morella rubra]|uniref:Uncharacterized protein n=1 Tax=Morella rubra TaxID=262757 RepID=A0A6A1W1V4_9ROSI|nr:hypothetical protein CJ030_MR4G020646 [Morella rubra]
MRMFWAVAYIPLTVLAVSALILTLGGGYLFGLPVGTVADSIGATVGAGAAFLLGRTLVLAYIPLTVLAVSASVLKPAP